MRYINHKNLSVGLPLAFSIHDYIYNIEDGVTLDSKIAYYPWEMSELVIGFNYDYNYNHTLKIQYNYDQRLFRFTYLICDTIVHQYTDFIFYKDDAIIKLGRIVDNKLAFFCWRTRKRIFYHMVK